MKVTVEVDYNQLRTIQTALHIYNNATRNLNQYSREEGQEIRDAINVANEPINNGIEYLSAQANNWLCPNCGNEKLIKREVSLDTAKKTFYRCEECGRMFRHEELTPKFN